MCRWQEDHVGGFLQNPHTLGRLSHCAMQCPCLGCSIGHKLLPPNTAPRATKADMFDTPTLSSLTKTISPEYQTHRGHTLVVLPVERCKVTVWDGLRPQATAGFSCRDVTSQGILLQVLQVYQPVRNRRWCSAGRRSKITTWATWGATAAKGGKSKTKSQNGEAKEGGKSRDGQEKPAGDATTASKGASSEDHGADQRQRSDSSSSRARG